MPDRGAVPVSGTALGLPRGGPPLACEALQGVGGIRRVFRCHGRQRPQHWAPSERPMAGDGPNWKGWRQRLGPRFPRLGLPHLRLTIRRFTDREHSVGRGFEAPVSSPSVHAPAMTSMTLAAAGPEVAASA